jgi:hypothetical protein
MIFEINLKGIEISHTTTKRVLSLIIKIGGSLSKKRRFGKVTYVILTFKIFEDHVIKNYVIKLFYVGINIFNNVIFHSIGKTALSKLYKLS